MGALVVLLDILIFYTLQKSPLKLTHKDFNSLGVVLLWGFGAGTGSLLGAAAGILQINRSACLVAGLGWPLILPRLIDSSALGEDEDVQESEEEDQ